MDNKLLAELNRRLSQDPTYQLPEGYSKVVEKEIENKYAIPDYFPIKHSKRVVIETLDGLLNDLFGFHILEPMAEVIEHTRAHPILKQMIKDKVMSEVALSANKNALVSKRNTLARAARGEKSSNSTDANPISKQGKLAAPLQRDMSKAEVGRGAQLSLKNEAAPPPKPTLGAALKIEIAKQPAKQRETYLDAAYALEEVLQAVEKGETVLERLQGEVKKKPVNRILEERQRKAESEAAKEREGRKQLKERQKQLDELIAQQKVVRQKKKEEEDKKKAEKDKKREEREKRN